MLEIELVHSCARWPNVTLTFQLHKNFECAPRMAMSPSGRFNSPIFKVILENILDIIEAKILGSNLIYTHHWQRGDLLVLNNPSLAHIAGPGSQGDFKVTGLRLMHRSTVSGKVKPSKSPTQGVVPLQYNCFNHPPFEAKEYCLFSLKNAVFYPRYGEFETKEEQRKRCKNVHAQVNYFKVHFSVLA